MLVQFSDQDEYDEAKYEYDVTSGTDAIQTAGEVKSESTGDGLENFADQFERTYDVVLGWTHSSKDPRVEQK